MIQEEFARGVVEIIKDDPSVIGLAAGGSWISNELDQFSDLDLILVTDKKVSGDQQQMLSYANRFGKLLSAFTGEHVGEPRLLICLYDDPLLHVDIKFLVPEELATRIENPVILFERDGKLSSLIHSTQPSWPYCDYQWIEDRFWTWIHYGAQKAGRGEYFEALNFLGDLRAMVLSPLLLHKNNQLPRGLRKVETQLSAEDLAELKTTIAEYDIQSIIKAIDHTIRIYRQLRKELFKDVTLQEPAEKRSTEYWGQVKQRLL